MALNHADLALVSGTFHHQPVPPFAPGVEIAGEVMSVGDRVTAFGPGDRVAALVGDGGLAEVVVVPQTRRIVRIPPNMDFPQAAAFGVSYGTAWHALVDRAGLREGESLVVLGASGGVGLAALDVGRLLGARVMACAGFPAKLEVCERYGPQALVNYGEAGFRQRIERFTEGRGADVVFDVVGGPHALTAYDALAYNGRHLVVGYSASRETLIPLRSTLVKGCSIIGVASRLQAIHETERCKQQLAMLAARIAEGTLSPCISRVTPLSEAASAFRSLADRSVTGKIVVEMPQGGAA